MDFGRDHVFSDNFPAFDNDWSHSRDLARKRFDDFKREAESNRRMFLENGHWPSANTGHQRPNFDRPLAGQDLRSERSSSPRWTPSDGPHRAGDRTSFGDDNASEASSLGNHSNGSLHRSSSSSSTASSGSGSGGNKQAKVHHIPIVVEGGPGAGLQRQSQFRQQASSSPSVGRNSSELYGSSDVYNNGADFGRSPSAHSQASGGRASRTSLRSPSPAVPRTESPAAQQNCGDSNSSSSSDIGSNGRQIPILVEQGMPKVKTMGNVSSSQTKGGSRTPDQKAHAGPYVTRIPVYSPNGGDDSSDFSGEANCRVPEPVKTDSMQVINSVMEELEKLEKDVDEFSGSTHEKQYRYLDEMLTRCMIKLDNVETEGNADIRQARKDAIKAVQHCVDLLESRSNSANGAVNGDSVRSSSSNQACGDESPAVADDTIASIPSVNDQEEETTFEDASSVTGDCQGRQAPPASPSQQSLQNRANTPVIGTETAV